MDIPSPPPVGEDFCTKSDIITYLYGIGFDDADRVFAKFGLQRIKGAIEYACSQPPGQVQNIGAYIRGVLKDALPPGRRRQDPDRYIKGRYGHVVQR